jgi:hypothetical protein
MAASTPSQQRTVDPFSSYGSNIVSKLTKVVTYDEEGMANVNSLRVTDNPSDSTSVVVSTGFAYKRAVRNSGAETFETLIHIDATGIVDFTNPDHYYNYDDLLSAPEHGYNYVVLNYVYSKSRPAPEATYQIIKPSQRSSFSTGGNWLFLACVDITYTGSSTPPIVGTIYDYDPDDTDNKRLYMKNYAGTETFLPTHNQTRDQSRIVYDSTADQFYFGYSDRWGVINANVVQTTIETTDWTLDVPSGTYYVNVDISAIGTRYNVVSVVDNADSMKIEPLDIEFVSTSETRIWMPAIPGDTLHIAIVG